jgi:hypothetical protein
MRNISQVGERRFPATFSFKPGKILRFYRRLCISRWPNQRPRDRSVFYFARFHGCRLH